MSTRGDILRRAAQVESDAVPEPWRPSDDEDALATVSDREHYRKNLVTLPDGAGEVPAYVWDFSRTPTIPTDVREEWTRGSAGRVLGPNGKFVSRGSDVPRLSFDGEDPGLLVEAAGRTNHVSYSSDFTQWDDPNTSIVSTSESSILDGGDAATIEGSGININQHTGTFSASEEVGYFLVEKADSNASTNVGLNIFENDNFNRVAEASLDTTSGNVTLNDGIEANVRNITNSGPNGQDVYKVQVRYDPSNDGVAGNSRLFRVFPSLSGGGRVRIHHAQIEEAPNASSPIVTQGSPVTRAGDEYAIFEGGQPEWWNPNEGTIFGKVLFPAYKQPNFTTHLVIVGVASLQTNGGQISLNYSNTGFATFARPYTPFVNITFAISIKKDSVVFSTNGSSQSNVGIDPSGASSMAIREGISRWQKLIYYPRALPESTLNTLTS